MGYFKSIIWVIRNHLFPVSESQLYLKINCGYITAENIISLSNLKIDAYIAAGKGENDIFGQDGKKINKYHFNYDSAKDKFICPSGHVLKLKFLGKNRVYKSDDKVCIGCNFGMNPKIYTPTCLSSE